MKCRPVRVGESTAIVCTSNRQPRCSVCGGKYGNATLLCDFPVPKHKSGTCDKRLCFRCATDRGHNRHWCPTHK